MNTKMESVVSNGQDDNLTAAEKAVAKPMYRNPILFSKKQMRILKSGSLLRVYRNGKYLEFGLKGFKRKLSVEDRAIIRKKISLLQKRLELDSGEEV